MKNFKIIIAFAGHIIAAAAVFCVVGIGALILHWARQSLVGTELDTVVQVGLHALELLFFFCDLVATGFWAIMSTKAAITEIAKAAKEPKNDKGSKEVAK